MTETHLNASVHNGELLDPMLFDIYRNDRDLSGGGVLIAISTRFFHSAVEFESFVASPLEVVVVFVPRQNLVKADVILVCIYIPPSTSHLAIEPLSELLSRLTQKYRNSTIYIAGDFNMPDINWSDSTVKINSKSKRLHQNFLNCFNEFGFQQLISSPTHVKGNTLDLIFINSENSDFSPSVINPGLSDHYLIELDLELDHFRADRDKKEPKTVRLYNKAETEDISLALRETGIQVREMINGAEGIDAVWNLFTHSMSVLTEMHVPTMTIKPRQNGEPFWFNKKARQIVAKQRKLYNKYRKSGKEYHLQQYKQLRKASKKELRSLRTDYLTKHIFTPMTEENSKCFYRFLKTKTGKGNNIKSLNSNNQPGLILEESEDIANELNNYFGSVFNSELDNVPYPVFPESTITVTKEGVKNLINNLKPG